MREIANLSIKLFIITAVAALSLAFTNSITKDKIAEQIALENELARQAVLSQAETFEQVDQKEILRLEKELKFEDLEMIEEVFKGLKGSEEVGYTLKVLPKGYGGKITVLVGISKEGKLNGMKVVGHNETPGLGAKATEDSFQNQYKNKPIDTPLTVIKSGTPSETEVQAITGSTITTQAVTDGVNAAIQIFKELDKVGR